MTWKRRSSDDADRDLQEELQAHLELENERNIERGMPAEEARYAARRKLGNLTRVQEVSRDARNPLGVDRLVQDVRYGLRLLLRNPGFSAVAILSLALGIGAVTAIFSFVNAVLLRPMPFREPERLVMIWLRNARMASSLTDLPVSDALYQEWREHGRSFESLSSFGIFTSHLTRLGEAQYVTAVAFSASTLPMLGVEPMLGRNFRREEESPGHDDVILLGYDFWNRQYNGQRSVVGKSVMVDNQLCTIIGVMPAGFQFPMDSIWAGEHIDFFQPMPASPAATTFAMELNRPVLGRLRPGASTEQARHELTALTEGMARRYFPPERHEGWSAVVRPIAEQSGARFRPALYSLLGTASFVLLIACANVANLLLARGARRQGEIALRVALGAGRLRILRQLLTESMVVALCGGALGAAIAAAGLKGLVALAPNWIPRIGGAGVDPRVLGVALGAAAITGLLFGPAPSLECLRWRPNEALRSGGERNAAGCGRRRIRRVLVVAEIGLAVMLLAGANVTLRSFLKLIHAETGFRAENLLTMQIPMQASKYGELRPRLGFIRELLRKCATLPGVAAAAITDQLPMRSHNEKPYITEGHSKGAEAVTAEASGVTPEYFRATGIRLRRGRHFTDEDRGLELPVAIVSETAARRMWPESPDAIGKRFKEGLSASDAPWITVVGVVDDARLRTLDEGPFPQVYLPYEQYHHEFFAGQVFLNLAVRFSFDPAPTTAAVRAQVRDLDKDQPVARVKLMTEMVQNAAALPKFQALVTCLFAGIALSLAAVGVYGVLAYSVAQRRFEIGVRVALGAGRPEIVGLVLREGMGLALLGCLTGAGGAVAISPFLANHLYGIQGMDPVACCGAAVVLLVVALLSSYVPARRAARVDPITTLRHE
jgi:putative ABC transport system permease protein